MDDQKLVRSKTQNWTFNEDELMSLVAVDERIDENEIRSCFMAHYVVHYPCRTCCLCYLMIIIVSVSVVLTEGTRFLFDFDQLAFQPIEKPRTQSLYAWQQAVADIRKDATIPVKTILWTYNMNIFVVSEGEKLLTVENIQRMSETEQLFEQGVFLNNVTDNDTYYSFCVAYPYGDERWPGCNEDDSRTSLVSELMASGEGLNISEWQDVLDDLTKNWTTDETKWAYFNQEFADSGVMMTMRSIYNVAGPYPNVNDTESTYGNPMVEEPVTGDAQPQSDWFRGWYNGWYEKLDVSTLELSGLSTSNMQVFISSDIAWEGVESVILNEAFILVTVAVALVWLLIAFHTGSCFISMFGMAQIMMSIPMSAFFYYLICNIKFWSIFNMMTIFVVMGIGADDMFIFFDCWQQAEAKMKPIDSFKNVDDYYVKRMSFTYWKAGKAMLLTTCTTCVAFLSLMSSDLPAIKTFGVYSAFVILFDFLFSLTVFPVGVMLAWKYERLRHCICCKWNNCFGEERCPKRDPNKFGKVEMFFGTSYIRCIYKFKIVIIVVFAIVLGVAIWGCTLLHFPTEPEEIWKPGTNYAKVFNYVYNFYNGGDVSITPNVRFVWGIDGLIRNSNDFVSASIDDGEPDYNPEFNIYDQECQKFVLWVCDYVDNQTDYVEQGKSSCFMRDYKEWRAAGHSSSGSDFPAVFNADSTIQKVEFTKDLLDFVETNPVGSQLWAQNNIGFDWQSKDLIFVSIRWKSTLDWTKGLFYNENLMDEWNKIFADVNSQTPTNIPDAKVGMFETEGSLSFTEMQRSLVNGFMASLGITFVAAFFALLIATANWLVSVIAVGSIAGIVCCVGMVAVLLGWDLGMIECLSGGVLIGFSVDYTVHLGAAYLHNLHLTTRGQRTRMALAELGVSITFGCITTVCCGFPLYLTSVSYFYKFGVLVIISVVVAIFVALMVLPSILLIIGPIDDSGNMPWIHDLLMCKCLREKNVEPAVKNNFEEDVAVELTNKRVSL
jgi:hypothetical protein